MVVTKEERKKYAQSQHGRTIDNADWSVSSTAQFSAAPFESSIRVARTRGLPRARTDRSVSPLAARGRGRLFPLALRLHGPGRATRLTRRGLLSTTTNDLVPGPGVDNNPRYKLNIIIF